MSRVDKGEPKWGHMESHNGVTAGLIYGRAAMRFQTHEATWDKAGKGGKTYRKKTLAYVHSFNKCPLNTYHVSGLSEVLGILGRG